MAPEVDTTRAIEAPCRPSRALLDAGVGVDRLLLVVDHGIGCAAPGDLAERLARLRVNRLDLSRGREPLDDHVAVLWIKFDAVAASACLLGGNQRRSAARRRHLGQCRRASNNLESHRRPT